MPLHGQIYLIHDIRSVKSLLSCDYSSKKLTTKRNNKGIVAGKPGSVVFQQQMYVSALASAQSDQSLCNSRNGKNDM